MKTLLAFCLLFAAANAFSLDALERLLEEELEMEREMDKRDEPEKKREITLGEFLDSKETPDPLYRTLSTRSINVDCSDICGKPPAANHWANDTGPKCASDRWVPNYEVKGGCECLTEYRCCAQTCAVPSLDVCHKNNQKGFKYGIFEIDCCGCNVTKCLDCAPPATDNDVCPSSKLAKPRSCYNYIKNSIHQPETQCFEATCPENPSDAALPETCDFSCEEQYTELSYCGFPQQKCRGNKNITTCTLKDLENNKPSLPLNCYDRPVQTNDDAAGKYYDSSSDSCAPCKKWRYDKISCAPQDAQVALASCHQVGNDELDQKCMRKDVSNDACGCKTHVCEVDHSEPEAKFLPKEVCPKGHVKLAGTSICGSARDLCFPCPAVVPKDQISCPVGKVVESADSNGCPKNICQLPTVAPGPCSSNTFTLDVTANQFRCV